MDSKKAKAAKAQDAPLKQKSPAEFFSENKNIAGFDNPGKSLYTTVRELVENALDSSESIAELPVIEVTIEEISRSQFNTMIGLADHVRIDAELYDDYENEKTREKRLAKEAREKERQAKAIAAGKKVNMTKAGKTRGDATFYKVSCKDNGKGMPHDDIPNMLGRVLSGTKYGLKQTRGKFGLGAKMALIWSKMSTGLPIEISSALRNQKFISFCRLDIDIHKNVPNIHLLEKKPNAALWHGAEIHVTIEGNWTTYRSKIISYMRQMAVITPYAEFLFRYKAGSPEKNVAIHFVRRTDVMPPAPPETKYHPSAVDLLLIKRLISETSKQTLLQFLQHDFVCINKSYAERLIGEMGSDFSPKLLVKDLTGQQIVRIHQLLRQAKFDDPDGECLSPAGEYNLRLGITKELHPDMVATCQGSVQVFEGHPFVVEAAVSLGGKSVRPGLNIFRFANRIPLLFEQGGDVITRTATKRISWNTYKISHIQDKVGVFVSIVSTKIPFKGTGKEYIGDDINEIASAVKSAIQQCCIQLKAKLVRQKAVRDKQERKRTLSRYIPDVSRAIYGVLASMVAEREIKRQRYEPDAEDTLRKVANKEVTEASLSRKLTEYVDQVDAELALDYATHSGLETREHIYLASVDQNETSFVEHHSVCVLKLISR